MAEPRRSNFGWTWVLMGIAVGFGVVMVARQMLEREVPQGKLPGEQEAASSESEPEVAKVSIAGRILGFPEGMKGVRIVGSPMGDVPRDVIEMASLEMKGFACPVQADGSFVLQFKPGIEALTLVAVDDKSVGGAFASEQVRFSVGEEAAELTFDAGVPVDFLVTHAGTGEPMREFWLVASQDGERRVVSQAENGRGRNRRHPGGKGRIPHLRPGNALTPLSLAVESLGFYRQELPLEEWLAQAEKGDGPVDGGRVELQTISQLSFEVVDKENGRPVRNAKVTLMEADPLELQYVTETGTLPVFSGGAVVDRSRRTVYEWVDDEGHSELTPFTAPRLDLKVSAATMATHWVRDFQLPTKDETYRVEMVPGTRMSLRILDAEGDPRGVTWVVLEGPGPQAEAGTRFTDDEGWLSLPKVYPGTYRFRPLPSCVPEHGMEIGRDWDPWAGVGFPWVEVEIPRAKQWEGEIRLPALHLVTGTVTQGGKPVQGASVFIAPYPESIEAEFLHALMVRESRPHAWLDVTDKDGAFYLEELPKGAMFAQVRLEGGTQTYFQALDLQGDVEKWQVELPAAWDGKARREVRLAPGASVVAQGIAQELLGGQ